MVYNAFYRPPLSFSAVDTDLAEEAPRYFDASSSFLGSALRSDSSSNVSTPRAACHSASTFESETTVVTRLDEAAMLASAELETPLTPWPSISPEGTAITGGSMRLSPIAISARRELDSRRALFLPARRSSEPTSTASFAKTSSPLNNGKRNTSANRRRRLGLRAWCFAHWDHPFPNADEKDELCNEYSVSRKQLDIW